MLIACITGYIWLYFNFNTNEIKTDTVCFIKQTTNIPCPSCGSTRSVLSLIKGDFDKALMINPLGYILVAIMLLLPIWIFIDVVLNKKTLLNFYKKSESYLQRPQYSIPLILLVIINWIWNITKGL